MTVEQTSTEFVVEDSTSWANQDKLGGAFRSEMGELRSTVLAGPRGAAPFSSAVPTEKEEYDEAESA